MPSKILNGKMWKVEDDIKREKDIPIVISSKMVETEKKEEAVNIIATDREKKKCPECGGRICLHPRSFLITPFNDENVDYLSCFCLKKKRDFIVQRKILEQNDIKRCHFCNSDFISVNKTTSNEEYIDITCRQCGQCYVLCRKKNN